MWLRSNVDGVLGHGIATINRGSVSPAIAVTLVMTVVTTTALTLVIIVVITTVTAMITAITVVMTVVVPTVILVSAIRRYNCRDTLTCVATEFMSPSSRLQSGGNG